VLILGIDTSGRQGSVALARGRGGEAVTLDVAPLAGGQYSEALMPTIARLMARHGWERSSLGLIAVASGPGSFTGLRIAIATVKGLAEAFGTPVVAVSVLEAIALASGAEGRTVAAIDAQRGEVFFGEYMVDGVRPEAAWMEREGIASLDDFILLLAESGAPRKVFTPDEGLAARLGEAGCDCEVVGRPSAEAFVRIAYGKYLAGARADVATLDANYLRRSDAEIFSAPRLGIVPGFKDEDQG